MKISTLIALSLASLVSLKLQAQIYDTNGDFVQTFAGSGFAGYLDGKGVSSIFNSPTAIVADSKSNLFVWDSGNYRIRKIAPDGTVTTFAGGGNQTNGIGTNVSLNPFSSDALMTIDKNDTIWMGVWEVTAGITVYSISNTASVTNLLVSLPKPSSYFSTEPVGICADSLGSIYLSSYEQNQIYKWTPTNSAATLFAGSGNDGYADGNGIFTAFNAPTSLACDQANNIYVWDSGNALIRKIDQGSNVVTFAGEYYNHVDGDGVGTSASFSAIGQMWFDNLGNLFLACDSSIRKIDASTNVVTMAGSFSSTQNGYTNDVPGNLARFTDAWGVCSVQGMVFVADENNQRIRNITFNPQPQPVAPANLSIGTYAGVTITGVVGRTYQIQSSPDMSTWSTRATILLTSSPYLWIDQNPISGNQFYQAILLP